VGLCAHCECRARATRTIVRNSITQSNYDNLALMKETHLLFEGVTASHSAL